MRSHTAEPYGGDLSDYAHGDGRNVCMHGRVVCVCSYAHLRAKAPYEDDPNAFSPSRPKPRSEESRNADLWEDIRCGGVRAPVDAFTYSGAVLG